MPLIESESSALAQVYARSLFQLAQEKAGRDGAEHTLSELEAILELGRGNPAFGEFLSSRALSVTDRAESLNRILRSRLSDTTVDFLQVLNVKGRLAALPSIVAAYDNLVQESFGRIEVDVFTAEPMDEGLRSLLKSRLQGVLGKELILHTYLDGNMIGGIKLRIGDQLIDGSVATQLRSMQDLLSKDGMSSLRARIGQIIQ
jgi:F-type H+-transporting ATPase subunit delta